MSLTKDDLEAIRVVVFDAINESFEQLSAPRFDSLEERMDRIEGRMDNIERRMGSIEGRMTAQESAQQETNRRLDRIESKLETIEGEIETLKNDVMALYELVGQPAPKLDATFDASSNEQKLRILHTYLTRLAKQLNIQL